MINWRPCEFCSSRGTGWQFALRTRLVDGSVRALAGKSRCGGLVVIVDLISAEKTVVATEEAVLDEDAAEPGQERSYRAATADSFRGDVSDPGVRQSGAGVTSWKWKS